MLLLSPVLLLSVLSLSSVASSAPTDVSSGPLQSPAFDPNFDFDIHALNEIDLKVANLPALAAEDGTLICETSFASPTLSEISGAVGRLSPTAAAKCVQKNAAPSHCTTLASYKGGQIGICGEHLRDMSCKRVAWAAYTIALYCVDASTRRAGGQYIFPGGDKSLTVIVY
jgi:hypothetical protein